METRVTQDYYTIEVRLRDEETIIEMKKNDSEEMAKKAQLESMMKRIQDQNRYKQQHYNDWSLNRLKQY